MTLLLIESTMKVSAVIGLALVAVLALRRRSAAMRHWVLAAALVCAILMPALQRTAPQWHLRLEPSAPLDTTRMGMSQRSSDTRQPRARQSMQPVVSQEGSHPSTSAIVLVWASGALVSLVVLLVGCARLVWIAVRSQPIVDGRWRDAAAETAARLGVYRPVAVLQSAHPSLLATWGLLRPKIVLPAGAVDWPDERVRAVLSHELSHISRADWVLQLIGGLLRSIYWFNPFVWLACARLRQESEQACDDDVLGLGLTGHEYANQLLDVARILQRRTWCPAPGMARPSSLQRRITAMLNDDVNRRPVSWRVRVSIATAALSIAIAVAGSGAAAQSGTPLSGAFVDALNNAVPNVTLKVTNNQSGATFTIRSDADGRFAFADLPAGDYRGEAEAAGYSVVHPFFRVAAGQSAGDTVIPLPLASIEETVNVLPTSVSQTVVTATSDRVQAFRQRAGTAAIAPPLKVRDVRPVYPPNRTDDVATVFLTGIIDTNGFMKGLNVLQPADADFARAAMDAVSGWQFESTRLHGVPVDTSIRITVRFVR